MTAEAPSAPTITVRPGDRIAATIIGCSLDVYMAQRTAGRKWCPHCRCWLAVESFPPSAGRADHRGGYCRPCKSVYNRRHVKNSNQLAGKSRTGKTRPQRHLRHEEPGRTGRTDRTSGTRGRKERKTERGRSVRRQFGEPL
jgi:hypothetical protein